MIYFESSHTASSLGTAGGNLGEHNIEVAHNLLNVLLNICMCIYV